MPLPLNRTWGLAGAAALLASACATSEPAEEAEARPRTAQEALEVLAAGNERFVAGRLRHGHQSILRRMRLAGEQHPFVAVLACADSRVIPELIFDQGLGDLFVIRVAGNVVSEDEAGSIEYAVVHLDVNLIVVLGHESCGAVTAALHEGDEVLELARLLARVRPAMEGIDRNLPEAEQVRLGVAANVRQSVRQLEAIVEREGGPYRPGQLLVGAVYDLESGRVRILDQ